MNVQMTTYSKNPQYINMKIKTFKSPVTKKYPVCEFINENLHKFSKCITR